MGCPRPSLGPGVTMADGVLLGAVPNLLSWCGYRGVGLLEATTRCPDTHAFATHIDDDSDQGNRI